MERANNNESSEIELFGLNFPSPICLAPGRDINADKLEKLSKSGYSFIEIGPLTPEPEFTPLSKNFFKRRLFTTGLMPNKGIKYAIERLKKRNSECYIAVNITYNSNCRTDDDIINDYTRAFSLIYDFADIFIIDATRPATNGMKRLTDSDFLSEIVERIISLRMTYDDYKPVFLRLSPDSTQQELYSIVNNSILAGIDAFITGKDKYDPDFTKRILEMTLCRFPIIACGGIDSAVKAEEMLKEGASLIQTQCAAKKIIRKLL